MDSLKGAIELCAAVRALGERAADSACGREQNRSQGLLFMFFLWAVALVQILCALTFGGTLLVKLFVIA
ncbi:hypothetical protein AK812_SmicGene30679 [Symbiodinium microadriaticum]|uniref:Uncharacterized protein n=1 Tax=Symbiodinium microadriaticum TaxID=2951 RepID=A0A1Q9CYN8_SYMMI|nr:hypothetical protein AK812_SmicGene30679 [Symbiodinium microadriaticum]